jgi:hypothetical protein
VVGNPSGTYNYAPPISEIVLEAMDRLGQRPTELTAAQIASARRSLNLVLVSWSNKGVNLWTVEQFISYMPRGVIQYFVPQQVIEVLADSVVLRQYQMGAPVSVAPAFTTVLNSTSVTVSGLSATPGAGQYIGVNIPVSVGGIVIQAGFYAVASVPGSGEATFTVPVAATSATTGGVVPQFVSTANSTTITVNFPNHGLLVGQPFVVQQTVSVGGVTLLGPYAVATVASSSQVTIVAPFPAGSGATVSENGGNASLSTQATSQNGTISAFPVDIVLYPLSRGDYMAIPLKEQQGRPTSYWLDRQVVPVFNVWLAPDQNGPYELVYRASQQVQDADITGGQTLAMPYRFYEAFCADLTARMAFKWPPKPETGVTIADLVTYAQSQWDLAADEDRERVSSFLTPDFASYFN